MQMKNLYNIKKSNDDIENNFKSEYDFKKIPTNVLNANTYSSYFYQTEVSRKSTKNQPYNSSDISQNPENGKQVVKQFFIFSFLSKITGK
jgi:hypothetical protein